jgi:3-deoxy-manno-octulosonate cytidylyltransferase (CMP-KDO synthetase)
MMSAPGGTGATGLQFLALIPARLASTRLPEKPLADIGGLPMVVRVAQRAAASGASLVIVCADSARVVEVCERHGVRAILTCDDHPTGTDRLAEACRLIGLSPDTIVVNVQGDEPLIPPAVIRQVASALAADAQCDIATAAHRLYDAAEFFDPNVVKVVTDARGRALLFSRGPIPWSREAFAALRADRLPMPLCTPSPQTLGLHAPMQLPDGLPALRHVGLYAYRVEFLLRFPSLERPPIEQHENLEQLRALHHGCPIRVVLLDMPLPPGVDTEADLERARQAVASAHEVSGLRVHHAPAEDRP